MIPDVERSAKITCRVVAQSPFAVADVDAELTQLGVIRILTGLLCLARMAPQVWALPYYFGGEGGAWNLAPHMVGGIQVLVLAGLVAAGVVTPVSTVALLVLTRRFESEIASASLSTDLLCLLLAMLIVTSAGAPQTSGRTWRARDPRRQRDARVRRLARGDRERHPRRLALTFEDALLDGAPRQPPAT